MALATLIGNYMADQPARASDVATDFRTLRDRVNVVTAEQLDTGSVLESKVAAGAITTTKLGDLAVTTGKIEDNAVTTAKIPDAAVTFAKLSLAASTLTKMKIGTYAGTGSSGNAITGVGFSPDIVLIARTTVSPVWMMGVATDSGRVSQFDNPIWQTSAITYQSDGFTITSTYQWLNASGSDYLYIAFKAL